MAQVMRTRAVSAAPPAAQGLYSLVKRGVDLVGSAALLMLFSPVLLAIAIAIWLDSGLPILYRVPRLGRHGRPFTILKFRTMKDGSHRHLEELLSADEERRLEYQLTKKLRDDPRRTRVGVFLRRWSLDELPQLVNVLVGEMSLIGPRPYFEDELRGRPDAVDILCLRPGITGLWQVHGRSDVPFEQRLAIERDYVRQCGLGLDAHIAIRTLGAVMSGRGAY